MTWEFDNKPRPPRVERADPFEEQRYRERVEAAKVAAAAPKPVPTVRTYDVVEKTRIRVTGPADDVSPNAIKRYIENNGLYREDKPFADEWLTRVLVVAEVEDPILPKGSTAPTPSDALLRQAFSASIAALSANHAETKRAEDALPDLLKARSRAAAALILEWKLLQKHVWRFEEDCLQSDAPDGILYDLVTMWAPGAHVILDRSEISGNIGLTAYEGCAFVLKSISDVRLLTWARSVELNIDVAELDESIGRRAVALDQLRNARDLVISPTEPQPLAPKEGT